MTLMLVVACVLCAALLIHQDSSKRADSCKPTPRDLVILIVFAVFVLYGFPPHALSLRCLPAALLPLVRATGGLSCFRRKSDGRGHGGSARALYEYPYHSVLGTDRPNIFAKLGGALAWHSNASQWHPNTPNTSKRLPRFASRCCPYKAARCPTQQQYRSEEVCTDCLPRNQTKLLDSCSPERYMTACMASRHEGLGKAHNSRL